MEEHDIALFKLYGFEVGQKVRIEEDDQETAIGKSSVSQVGKSSSAASFPLKNLSGIASAILRKRESRRNGL